MTPLLLDPGIVGCIQDFAERVAACLEGAEGWRFGSGPRLLGLELGCPLPEGPGLSVGDLARWCRNGYPLFAAREKGGYRSVRRMTA